ncbi:hypothetical protein PLICRDRAFT_57611 [Plicaturopsis crispa FD-325 SS-3]|uniref:Uncharacterized protein n=1 Tax=Plicaturopsis crispa FD-325 SS-3 TaxID=944288 RepID=A0A0C9T8T7_PLICR|nr:hypothetical protein PLICRDRAFT_57611 [Plicaturopsis crispa FD-325 SS-3]
MVSLWTGAWTVKRFKATVVNDIWPEVLFFSAVATMVCLVSNLTSHSLAISNQMLTVVGTVLGLVISFRTSTAYERYQDGRKMWTNIMLNSRNLAQWIWIHVPDERVDKDKQKAQSILESVIEKKSMINLIQAFSVAVKHYLRGEPGIYYEDLFPQISFLPRYGTHAPALPTDDDMLPLWRASGYTGNVENESPSAQTGAKFNSADSVDKDSATNQDWFGFSARKRRKTAFDPEKALPDVSADRPLAPARNPPSTSLYDYIPLLRILKPIHKLLRPHSATDADRTLLGRQKAPSMVESNVPLEITLHLSSYFAWLLRCGLIAPPVATGIANGLAAFQDTIANLERIRNTPLPFAYQVHLRMTVWLYVFFLPFQIFSAFNWLTIPATAFAAFLLLGFLEIGQQIENPFNYDLNDLDLDHFCLSIQRDMHEITAHPCFEPSAYVFTASNKPFAPADQRDAEAMTRDKTHEYWGRTYGNRNTQKDEDKTQEASGSDGHGEKGKGSKGDGDKGDGDNVDGDKDKGDGDEEDKDMDGIDGEGKYAEGVTSIRRMLLRNWQDVDGITRDWHRWNGT